MVYKIKIFNLKNKFLNWKYKKFTKCEFCGKGLFRYGNYHGGIDINDTISGNKKITIYLCNLCYTLFKNK